jgi:ribosome-binding ATPase
MYLSIIGSPGCGKTTLFRALTGTGETDRPGSSNLAVIEVPDHRLDQLSKMYKPRKTVYGRIEVCDIPSIQEGDMKSDSLPPKVVQQMRSSDAFILVLNNFDDVFGTDPLSDFHTMLSEFILSDMIQVETRLERIRKQIGGRESAILEQEKGALEKCLSHLEQGSPLTSLDLSDTEKRNLRGFQFLSIKPLMVVINCSEATMDKAETIARETEEKIGGSVPVVAACARLEAELVSMEPAEREAFMEEYGIHESLRARLIHLAYRTLGLISFLTVGEDECRAWPVRRGSSAQEAAATIHTDLSDKFIRSETVSYDDFVRYGDMAACKKAGVWRLEGKQYIVQDGDILCIRAGN